MSSPNLCNVSFNTDAGSCCGTECLSLLHSLPPSVLQAAEEQTLSYDSPSQSMQTLSQCMYDSCRQLLENLGFHDALPPEPLAEPSTLSSVDAAAASLEDAHLQNASLGGDGFDGLSPHAVDNGDFLEQQGMSPGRSLAYMMHNFQ